jgi:hypothetical protein
MPWKDSEARGHTHQANTPKKKKVWREVANKLLRDGASDASAIRQANAVVGRMKKADILAILRSVYRR